jgi:16S rRNA (cytidine1402-2'-O)-methyltransferase
VLVGGAEEAGGALQLGTERVLSLLLTELPVRTAARLAAEITGEQKNKLYQLALRLADQAAPRPGADFEQG